MLVDNEVVGLIVLHEEEGNPHWTVEITTYDKRTMRWSAKDRPAAEHTAMMMLIAQMGMVDLLTKFKDRHQVLVTFE